MTDDTEQAPEIPHLNDDPPTAIVAAETTAAPELAWSQGDEIEVDLPRLSHPWGAAWELAARIVACTALLAGALIAWHVIRSDHHDVPMSAPVPSVSVHPVALPPPTVAAAAPSAPVTTVTVTATPTVAPGDQLVDQLRQRGINVTDPDRMGRDVCQGRANRRSVADIATAVEQSEFAVMTAIAIYCPQYSTIY
jgi:hypothetical protein